MKRIIAIYFLVVLVFCITACKSEAVQDVENLIVAIGEVTLESGDVIREARIAYTELSDNEKGKVSNLKDLEIAEKIYDQLHADAVAGVIDQIGEIGDESKVLIDEARNQYDALTKSQQKLVKNFDVLIKAEKEYDTYIVQRLSALIKDVKTNYDENKYALIGSLLETVSDDQRDRINKAVGGIDAALEDARVENVTSLIDMIRYAKDEPTKQDLVDIIAALQRYEQLSENAKKKVKNFSKLNKVIQNYKKYADNREKTDKLYARSQYISACKEAQYTDLLAYPNSAKGTKVFMEIKVSGIKEGVFSDYIDAISTRTDEPVRVHDNRKIKEPRIKEGDTLVVYGVFDGVKTIKLKEEGSGWFGTPFMADVKEAFEVPVIKFIYTDHDNLGIIASGDPNADDITIDEEAEQLQLDLQELIRLM